MGVSFHRGVEVLSVTAFHLSQDEWYVSNEDSEIIMYVSQYFLLGSRAHSFILFLFFPLILVLVLELEGLW